MAFSSPISAPGLEEAQLLLQKNQNNSGSSTGFQEILDQQMANNIFSMLSLYQDKSVVVVDRQNNVVGSYQVDEIIKKGNNYQFTLVDPSKQNDPGFRANVVFEFSQENQLYNDTILPDQLRQRELRQRFEVEKYLSIATKTLATDGDVQIDSTALPTLPPENNTMSQHGLQDITYYDKTESRYRRGQVYVENDQLRLKDGSPLTIKVEKQ